LQRALPLGILLRVVHLLPHLRLTVQELYSLATAVVTFMH